jgi:hypothetical protein
MRAIGGAIVRRLVTSLPRVVWAAERYSEEAGVWYLESELPDRFVKPIELEDAAFRLGPEVLAAPGEATAPVFNEEPANWDQREVWLRGAIVQTQKDIAEAIRGVRSELLFKSRGSSDWDYEMDHVTLARIAYATLYGLWDELRGRQGMRIKWRLQGEAEMAAKKTNGAHTKGGA